MPSCKLSIFILFDCIIQISEWAPSQPYWYNHDYLAWFQKEIVQGLFIQSCKHVYQSYFWKSNSIDLESTERWLKKIQNWDMYHELIYRYFTSKMNDFFFLFQIANVLGLDLSGNWTWGPWISGQMLYPSNYMVLPTINMALPGIWAGLIVTQ